MEPRAFSEELLAALPIGAKVTDGAVVGLTARRLKGGVVLEWRGRVRGQKATVRLGAWPRLSVERARELAGRARGLVAAGSDPRGRRLAPTTTAAALAQYEREHLAHMRAGPQTGRILRRHLAAVAAWPLAEVGRAELKAAVEPLAARGQWGTAHKVRRMLWAFMRWAEVEELIERAPGRMRLAVPAPVRATVPSLADCRALFEGARALRARQRAFVRVTMLGGFRRAEAAGLRPEEWQGDRIVLGAGRTKQRREHVVPVGAAMAAELPALFGERPVGGIGHIKERLEAETGVRGWTFHDFRRALRSHLRDAGVDRDVLERVLGHAPRGVEGHYDYATLLPQMRAALELWEGMIVRE